MLINHSSGLLPCNYEPDFLIRKLQLNLENFLLIKIHTYSYLIILSFKSHILLYGNYVGFMEMKQEHALKMNFPLGLVQVKNNENGFSISIINFIQ